MFNGRFKNKSWYPYTIAICSGVALYVLLTHFSDLWDSILTFIGYFSPVLWGCAIAYIINPLSKLYGRSIFKGVRNGKAQVFASNTLAFLTVVVALIYIMVLLVPELISSVQAFVTNMDKYMASLNGLLNHMGLSGHELGFSKWTVSSEELLKNVSDYVRLDMDDILATSADAGKGMLQWLIAFLLSIYLLANKRHIKNGIRRFLKALLKENQFENTHVYLNRSNNILSRFVVFNLLDALLVGIVNMIFMVIMGMPYAGLVSVVVAVTNLVPTFGPFVGAGIGAFILLLVKPWYALAFLIFTLVLQLIDGYIIKPKLFGGSLGVPAFWVLIAIVVSGKMFGIIGILLSIPLVAILHFTYNDYFLPWLENRSRKKEGENT